MAIQKLIVTNVSVLKRKYGAGGLVLIRGAIARLVAADALRGISTKLEAVDHPTHRVPAVTSSGNTRQVKDTIDRLFVAHKLPDYLMILGGPDVIPFQLLKNPMHVADGDDDRNVPSDLPYASSAPFSTDISKFMGPTRVVGRLPDIAGGKKVEDLLAVIDAATTFSGTPGNRSFALSADEWAGASVENLRLAFGAPRAVELIPPKGPPWSRTELAPPMHFINCHGADNDPNYYGSSPRFPTAHEPAGLIGKVTRGSVIAAECCYGAQLYKPTTTIPVGIANTYLLQGAAGYCGSTNIAYGAAKAVDRCAADVLCTEFIKSVRATATIGRALLQARLNFVSSVTGPLDPSDLKTLGQFLLLGDPSLRPFGVGLDPIRIKGLTAGLAEAVINRVLPKTRVGKVLLPTIHRARRIKLSQEGQDIAQTKSFAVRKGAAPGPGPDEGAKKLLEEAGGTVGPTLIFRVETPAVRGAKGKRAKSMARSATAADEIQVTFSKVERYEVGERAGNAQVAVSARSSAKIVAIKAVVTRTRGGQVLSYKPISSR